MQVYAAHETYGFQAVRSGSASFFLTQHFHLFDVYPLEKTTVETTLIPLYFDRMYDFEKNQYPFCHPFAGGKYQ